MKRIILILALMIIPFCFAGCSISDFNNAFGFGESQKEQPTAEQIQLQNEVTNKLKKLENASRQYNTEKSVTTNPVRRVIIYIRTFNYNSTYWNLLGSSVESDFESYLTEQLGQTFVDDFKAFAKNNYVIPTLTDREIDFVHMFAAMNLTYSDNGTLSQAYGDLGGWGGDMCQLVQTLKADTSLSQTHEALKGAAQNYITSTLGGFNKYDLYADIDAYNIAKMIAESTDTSDVLANAVYKYYKKPVDKVMRQNFLSNCITSAYGTYETLYNRLKNNTFISVWCNQAGISITDDALYFEAGCDAFLEYLNA